MATTAAAEHPAIARTAAPILAVIDAVQRHPRIALGIGIALYVALWASVSLFPIAPNDLDAFFLPSARIALQGHPLQVYDLRYQNVYPNANGPLSLVPLTVAAAIVQRLGWLNDLAPRRAVIMGFFALFSIVMVRLAMRAAEHTDGAELSMPVRVLGYGSLLFAPPIWHAVLFYGHVEQPIMLGLVLLGLLLLRREHWWLAGIALGLAMLARTSAVLSLIPLFMVLLWRGRWLSALKCGIAAVATVVLGLLPLVLADRADVAYSLFSFHELLPVAGGNIWGSTLDTPLSTGFVAFAMHHDSLVVLIVAALESALVLAFRPDLNVRSRDLFALLTVTTICFPLLVKTLWPYYFLEPFVFATIWWLAGFRAEMTRADLVRWLLLSAVPISVIALALVGEVFTSLTAGGIWQAGWSRIMTVAMLEVVAPLLVMLVLGGRNRRGGGQQPKAPALAL